MCVFFVEKRKYSPLNFREKNVFSVFWALFSKKKQSPSNKRKKPPINGNNISEKQKNNPFPKNAKNTDEARNFSTQEKPVESISCRFFASF